MTKNTKQQIRRALARFHRDARALYAGDGSDHHKEQATGALSLAILLGAVTETGATRYDSQIARWKKSK